MATFLELTDTDNPFHGIAVLSYPNPTLADLDEDGDLDLIVGNSDGLLSYYLNTGTARAPVFGLQTGGNSPFGALLVDYHASPVFGDLDGDRDLDLVVGDSNGRLSYFLNTGSAAAPVFEQQFDAFNPFASLGVIAYAVATLGDLNDDGLLDLVVGDGLGSLSYFQNIGTAASPSYAQQTGGDNPFRGFNVQSESRPTLGDVDGDGDLDLVVGQLNGKLSYIKNQGTAAAPWFALQSLSSDPFRSFLADSYAAPAFGDIDGDGDLDLVVGEVNGNFLFLQNQLNPQVNAAPVVNAAALTLAEGQTVTLSAANFTVTDPDSTSFTYAVSGVAGGFFQLSTAAGTAVTGFTSVQLAGGLVQFVDDGNEVAPAFSITANDGALNSNTLAAAINYTPVNDAPVGVDDSAQTSLNTAVNIGVIANDTDVDGGALRVAAVTPGSNGSTAIRADGVSVRYTPSTGFSGFDSFSYTVSDGAGGTAVANVRVLVASVTGSNGNDVPLGTQQADFVLALDGNDRVLTHGGADYVDGGRGADTITGGDGADTLLGGEGADTFLATSAELAGDQIDGGEGTDTLVITNAPASIPANFSFMNLEQISYTGALLVAHGSLVDLSSLALAPGSSNLISGGAANSRITGTASADNIVDSAGNDDLRGAAGNDTIYGGFGQDTIHGGTGNDALYGGSASVANDFVRDIFVFNTPLNAATNVDQIFGFQANSQDRIALDLGIFSAITGGASLGLDAGEFLSVNGGNAQDGNDFIIFDPLSGNLFYDRDGIGEASKVLFATLVGLNGTLDVTDFGVAESPF